MKRVIILLAAVGCLLALAGCGKNATAKGQPIQVQVALSDMTAFDRAYIPALTLTDGDDVAKAKKAMTLLLAEWDALHAKYITAPTLTPQWRADFDNIDRMIKTADGYLRDDKPLQEAHGVLEGVRTVLKDLRLGYGIVYDPDLLTLFHEPMEAITLAVKDKTPAQLTADDLAAISEQYGYAASVWLQVTKAPFDPTLFKLTPEQDGKLRAEIKLETGALDELKAALDAGDKARVLDAASALQPHFTTIYTTFGDFSAVQ